MTTAKLAKRTSTRALDKTTSKPAVGGARSASRAHGEARVDPSLKGAFLARASAAIASVASRLDARALQQAVGASTQAGTILVALSQPGIVGLLTQEDPLAKARLRGIERRDQMLAEEGGSLSSEAVAKLLRISRQAVDLRRKNGSLLAIHLGRRGYLYPAWQFSDRGVLDGLPQVLAELKRHPALAQARFFLAGNPRLERHRPLDGLRRGDVDAVLRAARAFGEQGAG